MIGCCYKIYKLLLEQLSTTYGWQDLSCIVYYGLDAILQS